MFKRGIIFIVLLSFLFPLLFSCSSGSGSSSSGGIQHIYGDSSDSAVQVSGIKIASNYIELVKEAGVDLQYNISAVAQPQNAENKALQYTSSDPKIAEVSSDGIVAIKDFGSFNVTIQSEARQDIRQQVDFYVRENILTKIDVENNPLSFFGAYSIFQYGIDKEPDTNIGGSLSINMDRNEENPVEVKLLFNGLDMPVSIDIENLSDMSYEQAGVSLFSYFQGVVKGDDKAIVKLKADENSSLIDNGILQAGQTLYLSLKKEYDLVPGQASHVEEIPVSVTEIQVNDVHKLDRRTSTAYTLKPIVLPVNASNKAVTYSTSNIKVAKVSPTGVVTALNEGSADITVTSVSDGEVIGKTVFTVMDSTVRVKDIVFEKIDETVYIGNPVTVQAVAQPANATYKDIFYYSKNPLVATVNSATGQVIPRRKGTVEIAAVSDKGSFEKTITLTVDVKHQAEPVKSIVNIPSKLELSLESSKTVQLNGKAVPTYADDTTLIYKADESGCVSVDGGGLVTALKVGTGKVTVSSSKYPDVKKDIDIAVRQKEEKIFVSEIKVNQAPSTLYIGHTDHTIIPERIPAEANVDNELTVSVDDNSIVRIEQQNDNYKIVPLQEGSVIITLKTANGVEQEVHFNVKKVMNVKGYYTIDKVEYTLADNTESFIPEKDKLQGEFAINLLEDKYTVQGRLQYTPANPRASYVFNNYRYIYENKEIMLDTADKYSTQTKDILSTQNIKVTGTNTVEYTYTKDSFKAVVYLTKVNDEVKEINDRTMYMTPVDMYKDPYSARGYYEMTWFYGNSLNYKWLERYPAIYSTNKSEMPTSSWIGTVYHKECPSIGGWAACYSGGGGANGSVTNYKGAFVVNIDETGDSTSISSIMKVQMQGHRNFNLQGWAKYMHASFDKFGIWRDQENAKIVNVNTNAAVITNSGNDGSKGASIAYSWFPNNVMEYEVFLDLSYNFRFLYKAVKKSDRYIDLPTDKFAKDDVSDRTPPEIPDLAKIVPVEAFTGSVTAIE